MVYNCAMDPVAYLRSIVSPLCDKPESLIVSQSTDDRGILLTMQLSKADTPRVIGREGVTALAMRNILRVFGGRKEMHISLKIVEPIA